MSTRIDNDRVKLKDGLQNILSDRDLSSDVSLTAQIILREIERDDKGHLVSLSGENPSQLSAAIRCDDQYDEARRTRLTFPRYVRRHLYCSESISDADLDSLSQIFWQRLHATHSPNIFTVVKGDDLVHRYATKFAWSACMSGTLNTELVEIYRDNPEIFSMLCLETDDLAGRALIVNCVDQGCGFPRLSHTVLDRIYPNDAGVVASMRKWALERGYLVRTDNALPEGDITFKDGNGKTFPYLLLKLKTYPSNYPYLDSFLFCDEDDLTLTTYRRDYTRHICDQQNGTRTEIDEDLRQCDSCGGDFCEDAQEDGHTTDCGDFYCESCFDDNFFTCDFCGELTDNEDKASLGSTISDYEDACDSCASEKEDDEIWVFCRDRSYDRRLVGKWSWQDIKECEIDDVGDWFVKSSESV